MKSKNTNNNLMNQKNKLFINHNKNNITQILMYQNHNTKINSIK